MIPAFFIIFIILNIFDVITTNKVIAQGGKEINPCMKWLIDKAGSYWGYYKVGFIVIITGLCVFAITLFGQTTIAVAMLVILDVGYIYLVWHNLKQIKK